MGRIVVAVTNPVTATPVKGAVFSETGPLMDPTEWTSSYSASDADWLFFKGLSCRVLYKLRWKIFNLRNGVLKKSKVMFSTQNICQFFVTQRQQKRWA